MEPREIDKTIRYGKIYNMKKLLGIVVLGLLWCNVVFGDSLKTILKNSERVVNFNPDEVSLGSLIIVLANPTLHHNKPRTTIPKSFFIYSLAFSSCFYILPI